MNKEYSKLIIFLMLPVTFGALIADTLASVVGIRMIIEPQNLLGDIVVLMSSFLINGIIYATPYILFGNNKNLLVLILWFITVVLDAFTTLVAIIFELLLDIDYIDWTLVPEIFDGSINNIVQAIFVLIVTVAISLTAALSSYWVNQFFNES